MIAGRMKERIELLRPITVDKGFGEEFPGFEPAGIIRAELVKFNGSYRAEVGEHFPDYRTEFNIRSAHEVAENWRINHIGGYQYVVANIIPNLPRGMKTLVCDRINK